MEISEFKDKTEAFVNIIEKYVISIVSDRQAEIKDLHTELIQGMQDTIPELIKMCIEEDPIDQYGNIAYWSNQLNKCITCLEGDDKFAIIDSFYYEMRPNLITLINSIDV